MPNDTTNEARALLLLQDNGVLTLKEGAGLTATVNDIESTTKDIKIQELGTDTFWLIYHTFFLSSFLSRLSFSLRFTIS